MKVYFRPFQPSDLTELKQMVFALYQEDSYEQLMTTQKIQQTVDELTDHPERGKILIFTLNVNIVGYAILIYDWSNEYGGVLMTVDELYVKGAWRNRGIARQFFDYLSSSASEKIKGIQLEVTSKNQRALAYYKKLNFKLSANTLLMKLLQ
jgi:ribosomal protein S18 acetylase RimI-like enzyme